MKTYRSIFISDVHLGTRDCQADKLNNFLKHNTCDTLYLVGDIIMLGKSSRTSGDGNKVTLMLCEEFLVTLKEEHVLYT